MPLVDYSDSEDDDDKKSRAPLKRKRGSAEDLPPLPAAFHNLYATAARGSTQDDPSLHRGRKRQVPHVEGNWATHVYLEWYPTSTESSDISGLLDLISAQSAATKSNADAEKLTIHPLHLTPLSTPAPLHISLSAPLILQTHQRDEFRDVMEAALRRAKVKAFNVQLEIPKWVSNQDQSRWFLVAGIKKPADDELNRLLLASNRIAQSWNMAKLYEGDRARNAENDEIVKVRMKRRRGSDKGIKPRRGSSQWRTDFAIGKGEFALRRSRPDSIDLVIEDEDNELREAAKQKSERTSSNEFTADGDYSDSSADMVTEGRLSDGSIKPVEDIPDRSHCFHISLGWRLNAPDKGLLDIMADTKVAKFMEKEMRNITVSFESVKLKIGNQIHVISFEGQVIKRKGVLE